MPHALRARGGAYRDGLLVTWLMRSTLHLVDDDDLAWLHPLFAPRMVTANDRRLRQLGVTDPDAAVERSSRALPATRADSPRRRAGSPGARPRARPRGDRRPPRDDASTAPFIPLALARPPDRDASLDELARRYYACHAGATARDLAYWSGLPLRDCRAPTDDDIEDGPVPASASPPSTSSCSAGATARLRCRTSSRSWSTRAAGYCAPSPSEDGVVTGTWSRAASA